MTPTGRSPIYGVLSNASMVDFPDRMTAVMFTTGCNFQCGFCHNFSQLQKVRDGFSWEKLAGVCEKFTKKWVNAATITGGEPTLAANLPETIDFLAEHGFAVKLDTNGSLPRVVEKVLDRVAYIAMDVKCVLDTYPDFVKFSDTKAIAESIRMVMAGTADYQFRTTVLESFHTDEQIHGIGEAVRGAKLHVLQPFLPREDLPDPALRTELRTRPDRLQEVAEIMREYVEEVVIRGD